MPLYGKFILIFIALCHFFEREYPHSLKIVGLLFQPGRACRSRVIALTFKIQPEGGHGWEWTCPRNFHDLRSGVPRCFIQVTT